MNKIFMTLLCGATTLACISTAQANDGDLQLCLTKKHLENGLAIAKTIQNSAQKQIELPTVAREGFSYLPEGHTQQNAGYDSCPLTGSGYTYDHTQVQPTYYMHECDEQGPREFKINCEAGTATFNTADNENGVATSGRDRNSSRNGRDEEQAGVVDFIPGQTQVCARGIGKADAKTAATIYRSPSCERPLSNFQIEGFYPACQKTSQTYKTCHAILSGNSQQSQRGSGNVRGDENYIRSGFCALPQGQKIIDHATALNAQKYNQFTGDTKFAVQEMTKSLQLLNAQLREQKIDCSKVKTF